MKLVYKTIDGKDFPVTRFDQAKEHELTEIDNLLGKLIDKDLDATEQSPFKRKLNVLKLITENDNQIMDLLTLRKGVLDLTEETFIKEL